jgi:hypothetical protein
MPILAAFILFALGSVWFYNQRRAAQTRVVVRVPVRVNRRQR